ncbi:MAG: alpha/beta hydrolase [Dehalococcoidia bacterium]|nr:alpha/beta hydrolase [Dehalococcoidia bacterium]
MTNTDGQSVIVEEDVVWACPDGERLAATVYRPAASHGASPVLVDVHGGAWSSGDRTGDAVYCRGLAGAGVVVASVDYRQAPAHRHPAASNDVANAVRWARLHAERWGGSPQALGLIGGSSGGHLALLAATRPQGADYEAAPPLIDVEGTARARADVDASVAYVIALWPVSDPYYRYRYAKRTRMSRLVEGTTAYFGDEAAMRATSVPRVVIAGEATQLPPALVVQPGEDANVPIEMTFDLLHAWQSRGGHIEYAFFPGRRHSFSQFASPETDDMVRLVHDFVVRHGPA